MSLGNVVDLLTTQAWALHEPTLLQLRNLVARHESGGRLTPEQADDAVRAAGGTPRREPRASEVSDGVAVIPVQGVIARRASMVNGSSQPRGTSIEQLDEQLSAALADPKVHSILLDVDSPGGSVSGVPEFSARVRSASKPVTAVADGMMASAAYWIAAGAKRIVATRAASVGSIGVYAVLDDMHRRYEAAGVHSTLIASGPRKGAGTPGTDVTEEHKASLRDTVQAYAQLFFSDVGAARGLQGEDLDRVTTGQTWIGEQALALHLVDALGTREAVLAELRAAAAPTAAQSGTQAAAESPRPQSETSEDTMDLKTLDAATLRAQRPDLVSEISKAAEEAAVKTERDRIAAIVRLAQKAGIDPETQAKAVSEGWSRERAAETFLDMAAERKEARLEKIRQTTPDSSNGTTTGVTTHTEATPPAKAKTASDIAAMPMGVERFKEEFAASEQLRAEFSDEAAYIACRKSEENLIRR